MSKYLFIFILFSFFNIGLGYVYFAQYSSTDCSGEAIKISSYDVDQCYPYPATEILIQSANMTYVAYRVRQLGSGYYAITGHTITACQGPDYSENNLIVFQAGTCVVTIFGSFKGYESPYHIIPIPGYHYYERYTSIHGCYIDTTNQRVLIKPDTCTLADLSGLSSTTMIRNMMSFSNASVSNSININPSTRSLSCQSASQSTINVTPCTSGYNYVRSLIAIPPFTFNISIGVNSVSLQFEPFFHNYLVISFQVSATDTNYTLNMCNGQPDTCTIPYLQASTSYTLTVSSLEDTSIFYPAFEISGRSTIKTLANPTLNVDNIISYSTSSTFDYQSTCSDIQSQSSLDVAGISCKFDGTGAICSGLVPNTTRTYTLQIKCVDTIATFDFEMKTDIGIGSPFISTTKIDSTHYNISYGATGGRPNDSTYSIVVNQQILVQNTTDTFNVIELALPNTYNVTIIVYNDNLSMTNSTFIKIDQVDTTTTSTTTTTSDTSTTTTTTTTTGRPNPSQANIIEQSILLVFSITFAILLI
ncbi:hypothetical protein DFA_05609 [Cavenderia fasciculata]|uniref:Fibronectin type-III domain-containing protein n=1 Tax=Cavenderia fasciculata TaxID=261658 RepID=F4PLQ4_CACFS|nr:uncharacterized protein DFA_05609 [Cavenderia fasciculata]EGG23476.1 hypothetical protein DFA_05609 [Cavenderia fasciculata]|eukprot:XP_004361327.1 hypothetical protein DFA_05609 [Cavenderia fasciculata]